LNDIKLLNTLKNISHNTRMASSPTDIIFGAVISVSPLQISIEGMKQPLDADFIVLTDNVIEKKINLTHHHDTRVLSHNHTAIPQEETIQPALTGQYITTDALQALPQDGNYITERLHVINEWGTYPAQTENDLYIIINEGLRINDKVIMLKCNQGQTYLVLNKVYKA
jgi:hypothetical protein